MGNAYLSILIEICFLQWVSSADVHLPNSDAVGNTVNIFRMNPYQGSTDLGIGSRCFELKYNNDSPCYRSDGKGGEYVVADALCDSYKYVGSTSFDSKVGYVYNLEDYKAIIQKSTDFEESVVIDALSIDFAEASVKVSEDFKFTAEFLEAHESVIVTIRAKTEVYSIELSPYIAPSYGMDLIKLPAGFVKSLQLLPLKYDGNEQEYIGWLNQYGTHFIRKVVMGAWLAEVTYFTASNYQLMVDQVGDVTVAAQESLSFLGVGKSKSGSGSEEVSAQTFDKYAYGIRKYNAKGPMPPSGDYSQWLSAASLSPVPIEMEIEPILNIINDDFLGASGINNTDLIRMNLGRATVDYCKITDECYSPPTPDVPSDWGNEYTVSTNSPKQKMIQYTAGFCVLTQVYRTTFDWCHMYVGNEEIGDANWYWYISSSSGGKTVCSARCTTAASWYKGINEDKQITVPYTKQGAFDLQLYSVANSVCYVRRVQNQVGCSDQCYVYQSNGMWMLQVITYNAWDSKHQDLNTADRVCGSECLSVSSIPELLLEAHLFATDAKKTLLLIEGTACMFADIRGTVSGAERNCGGGCRLRQEELPGLVGVWWTLQGFLGDGKYDTDQCNAYCHVRCYSLK